MKLKYKALNFINKFSLPYNIVVTPSLFQKKRGNNMDLKDHSFDYIRSSTIKLIIEELNERKFEGALAEFGVYQGRTSSLINSWAPERTLYLIDTFTGFDERDLVSEKSKGFSSGLMEFQDTSTEFVMSQMKYPKSCVPIAGFFPESASQIPDEEKFGFVLIDVDLYEPIYSALNWFWPRLIPGGTIMVHDYGTVKFKGAKAAVRQFSEEAKINYLPLPDTAGSVAFIKG